jgi:hypothetical protein
VLANSALQSSTWGNDANPDGDTYSNLIEMALGTNPNAVDPPGLLGIEANPPLVTLLYQLDKNFPEEFVHPEWSTDLVNWHRININVTQRSETTALKFMAATAYPPVPGVCIYMRLKIGD